MSISISGSSPSSGATATSTFTSRSLPIQNAAAANPAVQQFLEYANMTPAQRLFAQMLGKLGLTQDQFNAMSPADKQKVEDKIRDMIKKQIDDSSDKSPGQITDKSV
jgi:hypothetical protein